MNDAKTIESTETSSESRTDADGAEFLQSLNSEHNITKKIIQAYGITPEQAVSWRWHMKHQINQAADCPPALLGFSSTEERAFQELAPIFNSGVTPYYAALMDPNPNILCPVRLQAVPSLKELIDPTGKKDPLDEVPHSPVKEVVQVYPDRVAFCVAQLCPVYCRYCFRKRRDEEDGLHYNRRIVDNGINYIASNPAIRDVLITGGDPFIASDSTIENLLARLKDIPHVEFIRFGTRTPVTLPYRCTEKLGKILAKYHPVWLNTHFNCVEEITPEAERAVANLVNQGIPVGNQSVLLRGVNDSVEKMMALSRKLLQIRVRPYYLFYPHMVAGTEHLRVPVDTGLKIIKGMRGNITGMGIPSYIVDTPAGKVPLLPDQVLGRDGDDLLLEDPRGQIWREKHAFLPMADQ